MGDLTRNFNLSEFSSRGQPVPDKYYTNVQKLAENLQKIRDIIDEPLVIVSGYRTPEHNRTCGGAKHSQHLTASAADIRCAGVTNQQLYDTILDLIRDGYIHDGGVGIYDDGTVHYDIRPRPARWDWRGGNNPNKKKDTK